MQTAGDIADMAGAQYFWKLDASSGRYWQIKLGKPSSELLTFQTPFGQYKLNR